MKRLAFALVGLLVGCGDTGQPVIEHPAVALGTASRAVGTGAWTLKLDVARIGLGPFVFCAGRASSEELCPASLAEVASAVTIDGLSEAAQPIGTLDGFVGRVRSAGYEYAWTWFDVQAQPLPTSAAPGGHSAHFEGSATSPAKTFRFVADVDVVPLLQGTHAVRATGLDAPIDESTQRLEVKLDPTLWFEQIDFDELSTLGGDPIVIAPHSRAWNAIVVSMSAVAPPHFSFPRGAQ